MFHTLEIATTIRESRKNRIISRTTGWIQESQGNMTQVHNDITTHDYAVHGVSSLRLIHIGDGYYRLKVHWNPAVFLDGYGAYRTVTADEVREAAELFSDVLWEVCHEYFNSPIYWFPSRSDFAVDVETPHVAMLTKLFGYGKMLAYYRDGLPEGTLGSFYRGCKSYWLNFYNKAAELDNNGASEADIEAAANILRIEVQVERRKLKSIGDKHEMENNKMLYEYLDDDLALQVILDYYGKVIGFEDFFKIIHANFCLAGKRVKAKKRQQLIDTMHAVEIAGGISEARNSIATGIALPNGHNYHCCPATFNTRLKELRSYGINPIPVPADYGHNRIPNPLGTYRIESGAISCRQAS